LDHQLELIHPLASFDGSRQASTGVSLGRLARFPLERVRRCLAGTVSFVLGLRGQFLTFDALVLLLFADKARDFDHEAHQAPQRHPDVRGIRFSRD